MTDDIVFRSATDQARLIRAGERSPVAVVRAHLDRIDELDDEVNAFVHRLDDRAMDRAREAERAVQRGDPLGPLHGVPVAVKDLEDVAGTPTTSGSQPFVDDVASENAPVVDRLEDAGAIVVGKTNTPEFGHKGTTDNVPFGPTGTPFDPSRNAGGSSGGSAAAVAAGMAALAVGSDGGGSVRIPSAWCGVVGLKATYRRVARPQRPDAFSHTPFSQIGPHARTVEDAALLFDAVSGPHPRDPLSLPDDGFEAVSATRGGVDGLDVAYSPDLGVFPLADPVRDTVDEAVAALETAGATVDRVDPDFGHSRDQLRDAWLAGFEVGYASLNENVKPEVDYLGADRDVATPEFVELVEAGYEYDAVDYKQADVVRTAAVDAVEDVFAEYDLLVSATLADLPVENRTDGSGRTVGPSEVAGEPVDPLIGWCLTYPYNMTGHPVASVPAGMADGLPVGLQVAAPRFREGRVLAAGAAVERVRPWADHYRTI
ncbi:MAG: amidase [Halobacteriaceae archaeon]